jgi:hypothetical protein
MKKVLLLTAISVAFIQGISQNDSASCLKKFRESINPNGELTLASRNVWRGASYGNAPSVSGYFEIGNEWFAIGSYAVATLNGNKFGYGNWIENYATFKYKRFSLTADDYFFFNADDSLNPYFDYSEKTTQHFIEAQLEYDGEWLDVMMAKTFYSANYDTTSGVYVEAVADVGKGLSVVCAYITGPNMVSFYDRPGFTCVGASYLKRIKISDTFELPVKASLMFNPNYKNVYTTPSLGNNPVYFVVSITL